MKTHQSGFASITVILLIVLAVGGIAFASIKVFDSESEQKSHSLDEQTVSEGHLATDTDISDQLVVSKVLGIEIDEGAFYSVTVKTDKEYIGKVRAINGDYFRLSSVYYLAGDSLRILGDELHGPENAMYIHSKNVDTLAILEQGEISSAITQSQVQNPPEQVDDALPSSDINKFIKKDKLQAVFFSDGTSYFARLRSLEPLVYENAVYRIKSDQNSGTQMSISLELVPEGEIKLASSKEILLWENLTTNGQISQAVAQYESLRNQ